jgi:hypothetical protein
MVGGYLYSKQRYQGLLAKEEAIKYVTMIQLNDHLILEQFLEEVKYHLRSLRVDSNERNPISMGMFLIPLN